ncbi:MAG: GNAT family N-acetyltransferase [Bdellovibrionales bacterium]
MGLFRDDGIKRLNVCLFEVSDRITSDVADVIEAALDQIAIANHAPSFKDTELSVVRRNASGKILAGVTGKTSWNWLFVDTLWVEEPLRGQGVGSALMKAAEDEAVRRGCVGAYLWTQPFYAPGFYAKAGYSPFCTIDDLPVGHQRIGMMKKFVGGRV